MKRKSYSILVAVMSVLLLPGCASIAGSQAKDSLTIERILTEPLTGIAGRDCVKAALIKTYGIDPSTVRYTNREPKALTDGQIVSLFWLSPAPADFMFLGIAPAPCFSIQRALALTQAKPHGGSGKMSAATYDAFKNGMLVSFSSTPDGSCVSAIHIEEDR